MVVISRSMSTIGLVVGWYCGWAYLVGLIQLMAERLQLVNCFDRGLTIEMHRCSSGNKTHKSQEFLRQNTNSAKC